MGLWGWGGVKGPPVVFWGGIWGAQGPLLVLWGGGTETPPSVRLWGWGTPPINWRYTPSH